MLLPLAAIAGGAFIFIAFVVLFMLAIAYGYYPRKGSGITQRPSDGRGTAPGADGKSHISTTEDDAERTIGTHGTR